MVPIFVALLSFENIPCYALAYVVFTVASITDYYDGKIARERNLISNFGKLFDPVADKILLASAFIMLMTLNQHLQIPGWTVIAILGREFLVTGARSFAASEGTVIAANRWGKTKAVIQMVYIFVFLFLVIVKLLIASWAAQFLEVYSGVLKQASFWAIVIVAAYTLYSGVQFARTNWAILRVGKPS